MAGLKHGVAGVAGRRGTGPRVVVSEGNEGDAAPRHDGRFFKNFERERREPLTIYAPRHWPRPWRASTVAGLWRIEVAKLQRLCGCESILSCIRDPGCDLLVASSTSLVGFKIEKGTRNDTQ